MDLNDLPASSGDGDARLLLYRLVEVCASFVEDGLVSDREARAVLGVYEDEGFKEPMFAAMEMRALYLLVDIEVKESGVLDEAQGRTVAGLARRLLDHASEHYDETFLT